MEKVNAQETVYSVRGDDDDSKHVREQNTTTWKPGYLARFPVLGVTAVLIVLLCSLGSVIVLLTSNNKSSTQWPARLAPNVVISALNDVSNLALLLAVGRGVAIAWWRKAMHGATVGELHGAWSQGTSSFELFKQLFRLDRIGIAALAAKIAVIDGTLFQRATTTYVGQDSPRAINMVGVAAVEFPQTGYVVSDLAQSGIGGGSFMISDTYTPVVNNWETSNGFFKGYNKFFQSCDGTCFANIEAIGFEINCTKQATQTDIATTAITVWNATNGSSIYSSAWTDLPIFNSSFNVDNTTHPQIELSLQYFQSFNPYSPSSSTCKGTVFDIQCTLRPAMVTYPITITNYTNEHITNGVSLGIVSTDSTPDTDEVVNAPFVPPSYSFTDRQAAGFSVGEYLSVAEEFTANSITRIGGIANALSQYLSSSATITYTRPDVWALKQQGTLAQSKMYGPPNMGSCDCSFRDDSLDTIVAQINQLTFLTATGLIDSSTWSFPLGDRKWYSSLLATSNPKPTVNTSTSVTVIGIDQNSTTNFRTLVNTLEVRDVIRYSTDFLFMGLAVGFTIVCLLLVCPVYWGYQELGRDVTLGPIEIAGAFRAPILSHAAGLPTPTPHGRQAMTPTTPNMPHSPTGPSVEFSNVKDLLQIVGDRKVTYGFVDVDEEEAMPVTLQHGAGTGPNATSPVASPTSPTFKRRSVLMFSEPES